MKALEKIHPIFGLACVSFWVGLYSNVQLHPFYNIQKIESEQAGQPKNATFFRILSGSHLPAVVDWIFISALLDSSLKHLPPGEHPQFYYQIELTTDLDPLYQLPYEVGATLAAIARKDISGAHALITRGIQFLEQELPHYPEKFQKKHWHRKWQLFLFLAYLELFELRNIPGAASAFLKAAQFSEAPDYIRRLEKLLSEPGGKYLFGIQVLTFMINLQKNPTVLEELKKDRLSLIVKNLLFQLNLKFFAFLQKKNSKKDDSVHNLARKEDLESHWIAWITQQRIPLKDPLGGKLFWNREKNRIDSTSDHSRIFALDEAH